jgi:pilus assembly protein Flp/PilA
MKALLKKFQDDESGATAIEYGLIAALISVGIIAAVSVLGGNLKATFETINTQMQWTEATGT